MNRSTRPQPQKKGVQKSKILQRPKIAKKNRQSITPTAKRHIKTSSNRTRLSSPGSISQTQLQISTRMKNIVPQQLQLPHYYHNQHRSFSTNGGELDVFLQDSQRVVAVDPKDGSFNTNPGVITPSHLPKAQHVVSPHLRQYVHGLDETTTILPENIKRAPIKPEHLTVGYKYLLKHLKYIPDTNRRNALALQFRSDFDILKRATTIEQAQVQFDRSIPNLWSQLSVVRMGISKLRRPRIPEALIPVTEYLGAQEGSGYFCAIPANDERFKTNNMTESPIKHGVMESRGDKFVEKAKMYNMDLHPADVERHYELIERFHFNGKERRGGW